MAVPAVVRDLGCWRPATHAKLIEYSIAVLSKIDATVIEGFNRFRRGGVEVGGILFGLGDEERIIIEAFRSVPCDYTFGPKFELGEKDHDAFRAILSSVDTDASLGGLVPVGWYHSHTRTPIRLSQKDLEIFDRYFPEKWQIALVLKPEGSAPTVAGFFFREPDGSIRSESSYLEFELSAASPKVEDAAIVVQASAPHSESNYHETALPPVAPKKEDAPIVTEASPPPIVSETPSETAQAVPRLAWAEFDIVSRWKLFSLAAALAILVLLGSRFLPGRHISNPVKKLSLSVQDRGRELRIGWDGAALTGGEQQKAWLEIREGSKTNWINLDADQIRHGSVMYYRVSENVVVHLQVGPAEEWVTFIGPFGFADAPQPSRPEKPASRNGAAESKLREQTAQILKLKQMVSELNSAKTPIPKKSTVRAYRPPVRPVSAVIQPLTPPPIEPVAPALAPVGLARAFAAAPPPGKFSPASRAGTLIWTGRIGKKGPITIDGNRPSVGALTGEIPGFPVRVRVYPGDLTAEGLTLFTSDPNGPVWRVEPPGPKNGWNKTSYLHNAARARAVSVLEAPEPQNGWRRLVLRCGELNVAVIVIAWDKL